MIVLALQEWRHWLEGSSHSFIVWSDHKNLSYLRSARRLNSRQARWALFLGRFQFTLTYRPGSKNIKPDALSRQFALPLEDTAGSTILPSACVVGAAGWEIEGVVQGAQRDQPVPQGCPPDRLFVPEVVRSPVLQWGHASCIACHPGCRAHWPSCNNGSGGLPWRPIPRSSSRPVLSAPGVRHPIKPLPDFCGPYPSLTALGRMWRSTSSRVYRPLKATRLF